jgi:outer membrane protein
MFRILSAATFLLIASPAFAEEPQDRFFLRAGPAFATFDATADVKVSGEPVRGGEAAVKNNTGLAVEGGWFITPNWSVSLTVGVPPKARISGEGTLASAGALGSARYAPSAIDIQYNLPTTGRFRPYIGAGLNYTLVYDVHGSAIRNLKVSNGYGPVIQTGAEYRVSRHMSAFIDVKKIWVAVDARGFVDSPAGPQPATARLALDPVIASAGVSWHF